MPTTGPDAVIGVAVGIVQADDGRVLVAERDPARHQGDCLEFPGGKIEPGEPAQRALTRELEEELGIGVQAAEPLLRRRHDYPDRSVDLQAFRVTAWKGTPAGCEGQPIRWLRAADLDHRSFPAANRPLIAALQWPALLRVTPAPADAGRETWLTRLEAAVRAEDALVQVRAPGVSGECRRWLLAALERLARAHPGTSLLLNSADPGEVAPLPANVGLHLPASAAAALGKRPVARQRLFSCACHDRGEMDRAVQLEADMTVVGPVLPTRTHPEHSGIGWQGLRDLLAQAPLPAFAIGGLAPADLGRARARGAVGIAGIRAFWPD